MTEFLHELSNAWFFYMTNEGISAGLTANLTAIGTGTVAAGMVCLVVALARRFRL